MVKSSCTNRIRRFIILTFVEVLFLAISSAARCEFTTIINVPPTKLNDNTTIGLGTQLNVFDGAVIDTSLFVVGGELNVYGGRIENYVAAADAGLVNVFGGIFSSVMVIDNGGVLNISNGLFDDLRVLRGGVVNMSGGAFDRAPSGSGRFNLDQGGVANISGGTFNNVDFAAFVTTVNIFGSEYRLDGIPINGLETVGARSTLDVPYGSALTGTLQDGTPFSFPVRDNNIGAGVFNLEVVALPAAGPLEIFASTAAVPPGVRDGQTMVVDDGSVVGDYFRAGWGSAVRVERGGRMGSDFHALSNSIVDVVGGAIGKDFFAAAGSHVTVAGGTIGRNFEASHESVVNVLGGSIDREFKAGGQLNLSGGSIGRSLSAAGVAVLGADFRVDDVPVGGLNVVGDTQVINMPTGAMLTGTLADGTPFAFSGSELQGETRLKLASAASGPSVIHVPTMPAPLGVRLGQTIVVETGGVVGNNFNAGRGGILDVRQGGKVGDDLEAVGAVVNIDGGMVGQAARVYFGSTINLSGGTLGRDCFISKSQISIRGGSVGENFVAYAGNNVDISGGSIGNGLYVGQGTTIHLSGGSIGSGFRADDGSFVHISGGLIGSGFRALSGSLVDISGGVIGSGFQIRDGSVANISGGVFGRLFQDYYVFGVVNMLAREFYLNGQRIDGLALGSPLEFSERQGTLSGVFQDGTNFSFALSSGTGRERRGFWPTAVLTLTLVPEPTSAILGLVSAFVLIMGRSRGRLYRCSPSLF